jgi:hypothetical protein
MTARAASRRGTAEKRNGKCAKEFAAAPARIESSRRNARENSRTVLSESPLKILAAGKLDERHPMEAPSTLQATATPRWLIISVGNTTYYFFWIAASIFGITTRTDGANDPFGSSFK